MIIIVSLCCFQAIVAQVNHAIGAERLSTQNVKKRWASTERWPFTCYWYRQSHRKCAVFDVTELNLLWVKKYVGSVVICTACEMAIVWIENQLRETKRRSWYCNMLTRSLLPLWFALTFLWCNSERVSWWLDFCIASLFCETIHNSAWPPPTSCSPAWTLFLSKWYACLHR